MQFVCFNSEFSVSPYDIFFRSVWLLWILWFWFYNTKLKGALIEPRPGGFPLKNGVWRPAINVTCTSLVAWIFWWGTNRYCMCCPREPNSRYRIGYFCFLLRFTNMAVILNKLKTDFLRSKLSFGYPFSQPDLSCPNQEKVCAFFLYSQRDYRS